MTFEFSNLNI